jgi:uncharacterized membrane protein YfcA
MDEFWTLTLVVVTFATVQSLFGVGLLVFGTPTLLLLGYSFESTIAVLLPASVTISFLQVLAGRQHIGRLKRDIPIHCVPLIALGLTLVLAEIVAVDMKMMVGVLLLSTGIIRFHGGTQRALARLLATNLKLYIMAMGLVHGLSNMGGGLLTVLVTSLYGEKESIRANIAYGYLIFASAQLIVLAVLDTQALSFRCIVFALISLLTYRTVGSVIYLRSSTALYQRAITAFIFTYGVILIAQRFI